mgnify:FL=1
MRALVMDGCETAPAGTTDPHVLLRDAMEGRGWQVETLHLCEMDIAPCAGCFGCWTRTPGECVVADAARDVARAYVGSELVALLTPVRFGGYGYHLKKAVDRLIPNISPLFTVLHGEVHHARRYLRYPAVLGVGILPGPDTEGEAIFSRLVERNAINMRAPRHAAVTIQTSSEAEESLNALRAALVRVEGGER